MALSGLQKAKSPRHGRVPWARLTEGAEKLVDSWSWRLMEHEIQHESAAITLHLARKIIKLAIVAHTLP